MVEIKRTLHVLPGMEAETPSDQAPEKAGAQLQALERSIKLGKADNPIELKDGASVTAFLARFENDKAALAAELDVPVADLPTVRQNVLEALDDTIKPTTVLKSGDVVDLTSKTDMAALLGLSANVAKYGEGRDQQGRVIPQSGALDIGGALIQRDQPKDPLEGIPFISPAKLGTGSPRWGRNAPEHEAVRTLTGPDALQLLQALDNNRGDPEFNYVGTKNGQNVEDRIRAPNLQAAIDQLKADGVELRNVEMRTPRGLRRMRKAKVAEAFSLGYRGMGLDQMNWSSDAHAAREANPHVSLVVESGRLEWEPDDMEHEVGLGTDFNIDLYYRGIGKGGEEVFEDNDISFRIRIRLDERGVVFESNDPKHHGTIRRLLAQAKIGSEVDERGNKHAHKIDTRIDTTDHSVIGRLEKNALEGLDWDEKPLEAMRYVVDRLSRLDQLETIGGHQDVLMLEPAAWVFSERSRFHYDETNPTEVVGLFNQGNAWIQDTVDRIEASGLADADKNRLVEMGKALVDPEHKALIARCGPALEKMGVQPVDTAAIQKLMPATGSTDMPTADQKEVVANAINEMYHEFSAAFDDQLRDISPRGNRGVRRMRDDFVEYIKTSRADDLQKTTTVGPFLEWFEDPQSKGTTKDELIKDFGTWLANEKGNDTLSSAQGAELEEAWNALGGSLVHEHLDIQHRQIEAAGTAAATAWMNSARTAYTGSTTWGNLKIDTFDVARFYTPEVWDTLSDAQKVGNDMVDPTLPFHAKVVNEVQIELTAVTKTTDAIDTVRNDLFSGFFMDHALAEHATEVDASKPETFSALLAQAPKYEDRQAIIDVVNKRASTAGLELTFGHDDIDRIADQLEDGERNGLFKEDRVGRTAEQHAPLMHTLAMRNRILDALLDAQQYIADSRGERVLDVAGDMMPGQQLAWENATSSKGEDALKLAPRAEDPTLLFS